MIESESKIPPFINAEDLIDLIRDFGLPKSITELLASHLKPWNLLDSDIQIFHRKNDMKHFLASAPRKMDSVIQLSGVFLLTVQQKAYKLSYFTMGTNFPSIPLLHSVNLKEIHDSVKILLSAIKHKEYKCL